MQIEDNSYILAQVTPSTGNPVVQSQPAAQNGATQPPADAFSSMTFIMIGFFVLMYLFIIRPQSKKEKERQKTLKGIVKGDKVVTRGGIWGVVIGLREEQDIVIVKIADDVKVEVSRSAIDLVNPQNKVEKDKKGAAAKKEKTK